jgi:glycosyltransferase involved in cell wall biosynthesis
MHGSSLPVVERAHTAPTLEAPQRALLVTSMYTEGDLARRLGRDAYSYRYVYRAFAALLHRWAATSEVCGPSERLAAMAAQLLQSGKQPVHLSFLPLHLMSPAPGIPNIGVPAWEFPDLPQEEIGGDPRTNWARVANELDLIITHTNWSRDAFLRAGVRTPVHVVPVPVRPEYFTIPDWSPGQRSTLDVPCYVFPQPPELPRPPRRWVATNTGHLPQRPGLRQLCKRAIRALPGGLSRGLLRCARAVRDGLWAAKQALHENDVRLLYPARPQMEMSGIVYTTILNPLDKRKNWTDLLTGYLLALRSCPDAQLVVKLVVAPDWEAEALAEVLAGYRDIGISHHCRLAFVTAYLSEEQLVELAAASTYYLNTSHAEGSCLPLQSFMAAGRPAVAPANTGMADSLDDRCGLPIDSHFEPARSPLDPDGGLTTRWHRLVWQSLHDQLQASYQLAREWPLRYHALAAAARARMEELTSPAAVWPPLSRALGDVSGAASSSRRHAG